MAIDLDALRILHYPAPALRRKSQPIARVDDEVRAVANRMVELMRQADGVGLAAPQIGLAWRLFVADVPPLPARPPTEGVAARSDDEERSAEADPPSATRGPQVYINPQLVKFEGDLVAHDEGCLSLPDITGEVRRPPIVSIAALDLAGERFTGRAAGLLARCWQHEHDHLDGILIIDRMTQLSRLRNRSAIRDLERDGAEEQS